MSDKYFVGIHVLISIELPADAARKCQEKSLSSSSDSVTEIHKTYSDINLSGNVSEMNQSVPPVSPHKGFAHLPLLNT